MIIFQEEQQRYYRLRSQAQRDRPLLARVKRLYGGAFTGRDSRLCQKEELVVNSLIDASDAFRKRPKSVQAAYNRLHMKAAQIVSLVRAMLGHDVDMHLKRFASVLLRESTVLRWNARSNTCQDFADRLLHDSIFEGMSPKLPKAFVTDETVRANTELSIPRYLISFGESIDAPVALRRPQVRSVVWRFYHEIRDNCDLIEYADRIAYKQASIPPHRQRIIVPRLPETTASETIDELVDSSWELPRDTLSILQTHLLRPKEKYSSVKELALTQREWVINRLRVLQRVDIFGSLAGAWGSAWLNEFLEKPDCLRTDCIWPSAASCGTMHVGENIHGIVLLGWGIEFITGREREWHKREMFYQYFKKIKGVVPS